MKNSKEKNKNSKFKNTLKRAMFKPCRAFGGMLMILVTVIGATSMNYAIKLSTMDMTRSMADRASHFVLMRGATYLYNSGAESGMYNVVTDSNGDQIYLCDEYNSVMKNAFDNKVENTTKFMIVWDKENSKACTADVGEVATFEGVSVTPRKQYVTIE